MSTATTRQTGFRKYKTVRKDISKDEKETCKKFLCWSCLQNFKGAKCFEIKEKDLYLDSLASTSDPKRCNATFNFQNLTPSDDHIKLLKLKCRQKMCSQSFSYNEFFKHDHSVDLIDIDWKSYNPNDFIYGQKACEIPSTGPKKCIYGMTSEKSNQTEDVFGEKRPMSSRFASLLSELDETERNYKKTINEQKLKTKELEATVFSQKQIISDQNVKIDDLQVLNESLQTALDSQTEANRSFQKVKDEYESMSNMFGRFTLEWMEKKGDL